MLMSVITPTHDPKYLQECHRSLREQDYQEWEWIIVPNNGVTTAQIVALLGLLTCGDDRIGVIPFKEDTQNIGAIKHFAFNQAKGDILVELDHDDLLTPDSLQKIKERFDSDPSIGFVYSDDANLDPNSTPFRADHGWQWDEFPYEDNILKRMKTFKPDPGSMSFIWYMPDHVRAWKASVYFKIGGHNPEYSVLDDQELLMRTYCNTEMSHIEEVLYLTRSHADNTQTVRNSEIQQRTVEIFHENGPAVMEHWCDKNLLKRIDLGGAFNCPPNYESIDLNNADICCDLNEGIPLEDSSCGIIRAHHIIEHLREPIWTMAECHRVLCDGGWLLIEVPSTDGRGAWCDPTHVSFWNQASFNYYTRKDQAQYIGNDSIRFQEFRLETRYPNDFYKENHIPCVTAWLRAIKGTSYRPHKIMI